MSKSFHEMTLGTKNKWLRIAKRVNALCLMDESNGHEPHWYRDELQGVIFRAMDDLQYAPCDSHLGSYMRKVRKITRTVDENKIPLIPMLDYDRASKMYQWRRDGQIPAGFLAHIVNISRGLSKEVFDELVALASCFDVSELAEAIGADKALIAIIEARKSAYLLYRGSDRKQYIAALDGLERELESRLDREDWNAARQFMTLQLAAPSQN